MILFLHLLILDWHTHYLALLQYDAEYGTCNVPQNFSYSCVLSQTLDMPGRPYHANLGKWLTKQRQSKKGNGPKLTQDRELLLQQLVDQGMLIYLKYLNISIYVL